MKLILHIGYPKVMSKFLQTEIFNKIASVNYLNHFGSSYVIYHEIRDLIFSDSDQEFDKKVKNLQKKIKKKLSKEKINLFSDEVYFWPNKKGYNYIILRLIKFFDFLNKEDLKILIFEREQSEILQSMYSENKSIFLDLDNNFKDFDYLIKDIFTKKKIDKNKYNFFECLQYGKIIKFLTNQHKLKVERFSFESLIKKDHSTIVRLSNVLNCSSDRLYNLFNKKPVHVSKKDEQEYYIKNDRLINFLRKLTINKTIRAFFSLKLKFYIKNFIYKFSTNKLNFNEKNLSFIKEYYKEN